MCPLPTDHPVKHHLFPCSESLVKSHLLLLLLILLLLPLPFDIVLMEDYYKRYHIPAFGNWEVSDGLPITQYFEDARQAGLIRYNDYTMEDLYTNEFFMVTPPLVSHPKAKASSKRYKADKETKKQRKVCDVTPSPRQQRAPKAVDEDLYKIPPELLLESQRRRRGKVTGFFTRCLMPGCAA